MRAVSPLKAVTPPLQTQLTNILYGWNTGSGGVSGAYLGWRLESRLAFRVALMEQKAIVAAIVFTYSKSFQSFLRVFDGGLMIQEQMLRGFFFLFYFLLLVLSKKR